MSLFGIIQNKRYTRVHLIRVYTNRTLSEEHYTSTSTSTVHSIVTLIWQVQSPSSPFLYSGLVCQKKNEMYMKRREHDE